MTQKELIRQEVERLKNIVENDNTSEYLRGQARKWEAVFKERGTTKEEYLAKSMDKVHLEKEIATYLQDWDDDDEIGLHLSTDNGSIPIELDDIRDLARHFYELGKNSK